MKTNTTTTTKTTITEKQYDYISDVLKYSKTLSEIIKKNVKNKVNPSIKIRARSITYPEMEAYVEMKRNKAIAKAKADKKKRNKSQQPSPGVNKATNTTNNK